METSGGSSGGSNGNREAKPGHKVPLDWSRLLGFDQATPVPGAGAPRVRLARVGVKVGAKPGLKPN
jgi:hypothetical protein